MVSTSTSVTAEKPIMIISRPNSLNRKSLAHVVYAIFFRCRMYFRIKDLSKNIRSQQCKRKQISKSYYNIIIKK